MNPFKSCLDLKIFYPIQVIDFRFQFDYMTPQNIRLLKEYETTPEHTFLYGIILKHKEIKLASDGKKLELNLFEIILNDNT